MGAVDGNFRARWRVEPPMSTAERSPMRRRLIPVLVMALWPFALIACTDDDPEVGTVQSSTTVAPEAGAVTIADVVATFDAAGYEVSEVEMDAPSAAPSGADGHQLLEVDGGDLPDAADVEVWVFADDEAAEAGADEVRDAATDPDADGGAFVSVNGSVVGLFGCTCEGDVALAEVFGDLDFGPATIGAGPSEAGLPDTVAAALSAIGADAEVSGEEPRYEVGADEALVANVTRAGETERIEIHVFADSTAANEGADEIDDEIDDYCGGVCEEILPTPVVVGEIVFLPLEGSAFADELAAL